MSNAIFTYNQDNAAAAGASKYITDTGPYRGVIASAVYVKSTQKGTQGMEFSFESIDGQTANYLTIYYARANNEPLQGGINMINAIMGCSGVQTMSSASRMVNNVQENYAPEIENKPIGLLLQKILYTKGNSEDGFKFEIKMPFDAVSGQTVQEKLEGKPAEKVSKWAETLTDKDERKSNHPQGDQYEQYNQMQGGF